MDKVRIALGSYEEGDSRFGNLKVYVAGEPRVWGAGLVPQDLQLDEVFETELEIAAVFTRVC